MSKDHCALEPSYGHLKDRKPFKNRVSTYDSCKIHAYPRFTISVVQQPPLISAIPKILTLIFGNVAPVKLLLKTKASVGNGISFHAPYGSLSFWRPHRTLDLYDQQLASASKNSPHYSFFYGPCDHLTLIQNTNVILPEQMKVNDLL
jgi:hypothetical protein